MTMKNLEKNIFDDFLKTLSVVFLVIQNYSDNS